MFPDHTFVLQGFARSVIRRKARRLARCRGFHAQDRCDLEQELLVRLLTSLSRFDPERGHIHVYVATVIERSAAMLLRQRQAQKRDSTGIQSLDAPATEGEPLDRHDTDWDAERSDLAHDLDGVLAALPADLRDLAERLRVQTVTQAAHDRNVPRSTLMRQVMHLRRCFEDAGLRIYL